MILSPHFTLEEMTESAYAARNSIDNTPGPEIVERLRELCDSVLEPVRRQFGPVRVTSGYRCPALNEGIGGAMRSQHMFGQAADIKVAGVTAYDVCRWLELSGVPFDSLIHEFGSWTHVSHRAVHNRGRCYTAVKVGTHTKYIPGIQPV